MVEPVAPPDGSKRGGVTIGIAVAVVVVALVAASLIWLTGNDADASTITLVAATSTGADPFTESVQIGKVPIAEAPAATAVAATLAATPKDETTGVLLAKGTTPGLYGGSNDAKVCDPDRLVKFLEKHKDKAKAWASVLGIKVSDIADYVAGLAPVILTADTLVTNHGYANGKATSSSSVLQAGTAVMVDNTGVPRVKCNCGNPLTEPTLVSLADADTSGDPWPGYRADRVTCGHEGEPVDHLILVDLKTGETIDIKVGSSAGGGDRDVLPGTLNGRWTLELRDRSNVLEPYQPSSKDGSCLLMALAGKELVGRGSTASIDGLGSLGDVEGTVDGGTPDMPGAPLGGVVVHLSPVGKSAPEITLAVIDTPPYGLAGGASTSLKADGSSALGDCQVGVFGTPEGGAAPLAPTTAATAPTTTTAIALRPGLACRDLDAQGLSYVDAVAYWRANGMPPNMDVDGNGIPCETVYPKADVTAVWGTDAAAPATTAASGGAGPCSKSAITAAVKVLVPDLLERSVGVGEGFCNGRFAAISYTTVEAQNDAEFSGFLEWNGTTWVNGDCEKYNDSPTAYGPHSNTVPNDIYQGGCNSG